MTGQAGSTLRRLVPAFIVLGLVVGLVVAVPLVRSAFRPPAGPEEPSPPRTTERSAPVPVGGNHPFVPLAYREGPFVVMSVTFPDGTSAEVLFTEELGTTSIGPFAYLKGVPEECHPELKTTRGKGVENWIRPREPIAVFEGTEGEPVGYWRGKGWAEPWNFLAFDFGSWTGVMACQADAMADADELALVAGSVDARKAEDGFPIVSPHSPLRIVRTGDQVGPRILFVQEASGPDPTLVELTVSGCPPSAIELSPGGTAEGCLEGGIRVYVQGYVHFRKEVAEGLRVRNVERPPG